MPLVAVTIRHHFPGFLARQLQIGNVPARWSLLLLCCCMRSGARRSRQSIIMHHRSEISQASQLSCNDMLLLTLRLSVRAAWRSKVRHTNPSLLPLPRRDAS
jgi:hypothetical protein